MQIRSRDVRKFRRNAATVIAGLMAISKWRRRSRARRVLDGSVGSMKRHPVRAALSALALAASVRAVIAARSA
jgi:hypothetical protein